jgi:ATP-dependent Lon protease
MPKETKTMTHTNKGGKDTQDTKKSKTAAPALGSKKSQQPQRRARRGEDDEDSDDDSDSDYVPEEDDEEEEWETDDDEEDEEDGEDEEDEDPVFETTRDLTKKFRDYLMSYTQPSKSSSKKRREVVEEEEEESEEEDLPHRKSKRLSKSKKDVVPSSKAKTKTKSNKKVVGKKSRFTEEEETEDEDDDDEDEGEDEDQNIMIILGGGNEDDMMYYDNPQVAEAAEIQQMLECDNEDCNSDDEKTFMKEDYQQFEYLPKDETSTTSLVPTTGSPVLPGRKKKVRSHKSKRRGESSDEEEDPEATQTMSVEDEYKELIDLKKHLAEKLKRNPKSKIIINAMADCRASIGKLVKKARTKNTKDYYKLIKTEQKNTVSEIDYFKKKLSHKEQLAIMQEMQSINEHIHIDKPYRLRLLQTKLPAKYKATVMNKLNAMQAMEPGDTEYHKMKTWVDTFMRIPFNTYKSLSVNIDDGMEVCDTFMKNAMHQLDDCVYGLQDAKMQVMQVIGQWITNPSAMGSAIAIQGPPGTGKCLALNTPILMYDGSIKMVQEVVVGDVLMGDDGTPRNVLGLGRGQDTMYDVIGHTTGEAYRVNSEHILSLMRVVDGTVIDIPVQEYLALSVEERQGLQGWRMAGVEFPAVPVDQDPYQVGVDLGRSPRAIPVKYLRNERTVRLAVFAGILDYGAYCHYDTDTRRQTFTMKVGEVGFLTDLKYLIRSLGYGCLTRTTPAVTETILEIWRSSTRLGEIPSQVHPYLPVKGDPNPLDLCELIQVSPYGPDDYYGFEIDGNRRFVLGDFTVTHNTSIIRDGISKILGREFAFITLGGAGDSSFLEGHSYTYEGSSWGKIVQILIDSKCMNPVIFFDELDKLSDTPRGQEITGILTHLTDTTQNSQFHDKYFSEIDFDLSKCLFIFSYNDEALVNPILKDRLYKIHTKGYDTAEKVVIAKKYLLPKIREQVNFQEEDIVIPDETIQYIVTTSRFTQGEQGVRNLKRCLEIIYTKLNLFRLMRVDDAAESQKILGKNVELMVTFPFTVTKAVVDKLVRGDDTHNNQSLLAMYV